MIYQKGDFIGQSYEVLDLLGIGGFGAVYLVRSRRTNNVVALKTLKDELLEDAEATERFVREARIWVNLRLHPYIVRAYYVDTVHGRLCVVMEHIAPDETGLNSLEGYLRLNPPDFSQSI